MVPKVYLHDLLLAAPRPKISIRYFWRRGDQMGQISKFFPWRVYFGPELNASGPKSFPPGFFTHFGRPTAKNFDSVFLTELRPNGSSFQIFLIVDCGAPKMGKKSWRETFETIGVRSEIFPGQNFENLTHLKNTEPRLWSHAGQKHQLVARRWKRPIRNFRRWGAQNG